MHIFILEKKKLTFHSNRTRLKVYFLNIIQKNKEIYSIYISGTDKHKRWSLLGRGSFSTLLFRDGLTASLFSFFASFRFFVLVSPVTVPFFTFMATSTVTTRKGIMFNKA